MAMALRAGALRIFSASKRKTDRKNPNYAKGMEGSFFSIPFASECEDKHTLPRLIMLPWEDKAENK